jgi:Ca2+-binding RTX toxin-like protein
MGGAGNDWVFGGADGDRVYGNSGNDSVFGNAGHDLLRGGAGDDWVYGGADDDIAFGDKGNDRVSGDKGNDALFGSAGNDVVAGNSGDDWLSGDSGADTLTGGDGRDYFYFGGPGLGGDAITDFTLDSDLIVIDGRGFGNLPTGLLDSRAFALAGQETSATRFVFSIATNVLSYDPDGSGALPSVPLAGFTGRIGLTAHDIYVVGG